MFGSKGIHNFGNGVCLPGIRHCRPLLFMHRVFLFLVSDHYIIRKNNPRRILSARVSDDIGLPTCKKAALYN